MHIYGQCVAHQGIRHALGDEPCRAFFRAFLGNQVVRGDFLLDLAVVALADVRWGAENLDIFAGNVPLDVVACLVGDGLEGELVQAHGVAGVDAHGLVGDVLGFVVEGERIERKGALDERPEGEVRVGERLGVELEVGSSCAWAFAARAWT